jgi:D-inositol-3-phosphate glycosyltransferase
VSSHDPARWADAIAGLLRRDPDELSRAAVAHAQHFSWANTVDGLLASYDRAITDYAGARRRSAAGDALARHNGRRWSMRRGVRA